MKTSQSFRIYFTIKSDKEKDGKAPLYVVITINKEKCFIALKQKMVDTKIWDFGKGALKGTKEETRELNWAFRRYVTPYSVAKLTTYLLAKKCSLCFSSIGKDNYLPISI